MRARVPRSSTVTIRFQPVGSAPHLRQKIFKVSAANRFETVVSFLGKKLKGMEGVDGGGGGGGGGVFCYVNSVFAPGLDEGVGGLWRVSRWSFWELWREGGGRGRGWRMGYEVLESGLIRWFAVLQDG